ncbi:MAG: hypothetical protein Kow00106_24950 [Anaerolineae bacterium]
MIRRTEAGVTWLIHQAAHAYIAGKIAAHWVGVDNMTLVPRDDLLIAAMFHDAGWYAAERTPRINGQGLPRTFTEMDLDEHFDIWRASIESVFAQSRYAALLTSLHCAALYALRLRYLDDPPADRQRIEAFLDERHAWQEALIAALRDHPLYSRAITPAALDENLRLLQVWDYLSLLVCMGNVHEQVLEDVPVGRGQRATLRLAADGLRGMALAPFPLDEPLTVWIEARPVNKGSFASDAELQEALKDIPYRPLAFEFVTL